MRDVVFCIVLAAGVIGVVRFSLGAYATHWYMMQARSVKALKQWDCERFHDIMYQPRPLAVIVNDWLEGHHV